jgi:hypothetical protein
MNITIAAPIIRQLLQVVGGFLIAHGYLDEGMSDTFIGLGLNAATLIWWAYDRHRINKVNRTIAKIAHDATDKAGA